MAVTNGSGAVLGVNSYDEYGIPGAGNIGRFQYTGQAWLPELGMYYYKARIYSPTLGRFMQTDSIGYAAGMNLYAYVNGDPVNLRDPSGHDVTCNDGTVITGENKDDQVCQDSGVDSDSFTNGSGTHSYGLFGGSILFGFAGGDFGSYSALLRSAGGGSGGLPPSDQPLHGGRPFERRKRSLVRRIGRNWDWRDRGRRAGVGITAEI